MITAILEGKSTRPMNVRQIMNECLKGSWIEMTEREREAFYNRYLTHMKLSVSADGQACITIEA